MLQSTESAYWKRDHPLNVAVKFHKVRYQTLRNMYICSEFVCTLIKHMQVGTAIQRKTSIVLFKIIPAKSCCERTRHTDAIYDINALRPTYALIIDMVFMFAFIMHTVDCSAMR